VSQSQAPKKTNKAMIGAIIIIVILVVAAGALLINKTSSPNSVDPTPTPTATPSPLSGSTPSPTATPIPLSSSTPSPTVVPYDFNISGFNVTGLAQGDSFAGIIVLTTFSGNAQSINPNDVIWSADSGSSGIQCDFGSISYSYPTMIDQWFDIPDGFTSTLTITIPSSTPTNNYTITVTAQIGSISHSTSCLVSVYSGYVTVSGTVNAGNSNITPTQIAFIDKENPNVNYITTLTGNTYSISVLNVPVYYVMVSDSNGSESNGIWYNWYDCGSCSVGVPVGSTSMTQDFTVSGS